MKSPYFPHDYNARNDEKIIDLIRVHGWEGYGIYWALTEKMHEAGGWLNLDLESIAFDLRITAEKLEPVVNKFKLFRFKDKKFTSDRVLKNIKIRKQKAVKASESATIGWGYRKNNVDANAMRTQCDGNAKKERKEKEIKEKESKENITTTVASPSFKNDCPKCKGKGIYVRGGFDVMCSCGEK